MIGILIIAHGNLGDSLLRSAKHVLGSEPIQCAAFAVDSHHNFDTLMPKAKVLVEQLNSGDGVIILSDIYGATPCNIVLKLIQTDQVEGVAGVNLPMLLRTITYRNLNLDLLIEKAVSGGREGVVHFNQDHCERYE